MRTNSVNIQPLSEVKYMFSFHSTALALLSSAGFTPPFRLQKQAEMDAQSLRVTATSLGCTGWWGWGGLTGWECCELFCQQAWSSCSIPAWGYPNMGLWSIQIHQVKQEIQMLTGHCSVTFGKATITRKISSPGHDLLAAIWERGKMHAFFFFFFPPFRDILQRICPTKDPEVHFCHSLWLHVHLEHCPSSLQISAKEEV